jgi:predicted  nucleic acid-binding Zn-ribbon protein
MSEWSNCTRCGVLFEDESDNWSVAVCANCQDLEPITETEIRWTAEFNAYCEELGI